MRLNCVCFSYGDKPVLDNLSIDLPDSGVTAIAGASGCGKTTLLHMLAGLKRPASGELISPAPIKTAILFQEDRLLPDLDCLSQLCAVLPRGADASKWLRAVGLEREAHSPTSSLSGGMKRRLALARAMAYGADKELLILDEPFTGVDPATAQAIMKEIRALGVPVIYSAHDSESLALADHLVRFAGPPLTLI